MTRGGSQGPIAAPLRDAGEFDLVRAIAAALGDAAEGLGDDASVLLLPRGESLVVSVDACVEGVHFRPEWLDAHEIGYRAAAAAMSDLAAMAATPRALLLALALPERWVDAAPAIARGAGELASSVGAKVIGGNLTRASELSITSTVIGSAFAPLHRSGVLDGDAVYVTGRLGGPAAALRALRAGDEPGRAHRERFARPSPRVRAAQWLAANGAVAAIDVSDGLLADLENLAAASGIAIALEADSVPRVEGVTIEDALGSGEEYEIVVAARRRLDAAAFESRFGIPLTRIGEARGGPPRVLVDGVERVAKGTGHDHFSE